MRFVAFTRQSDTAMIRSRKIDGKLVFMGPKHNIAFAEYVVDDYLGSWTFKHVHGLLMNLTYIVKTYLLSPMMCMMIKAKHHTSVLKSR